MTRNNFQILKNRPWLKNAKITFCFTCLSTLRAASDFYEVCKASREGIPTDLSRNENLYTSVSKKNPEHTNEPLAVTIKGEPIYEVSIKVEAEDPVGTGYASDHSDTVVKREPVNYDEDYDQGMGTSMMQTVEVMDLMNLSKDNIECELRDEPKENPFSPTGPDVPENELKIKTETASAHYPPAQSDLDDDETTGWWDSMYQNDDDDMSVYDTRGAPDRKYSPGTVPCKVEIDVVTPRVTSKVTMKQIKKKPKSDRPPKIHLSKDATSCPVCGKDKFSTREVLVDHVRRHELNQTHDVSEDEITTDYYSCPICHKRFATTTKLRIHGRTHEDPMTINHSYCSVCQETVKDKPIVQHCIDNHADVTEKGAFKCTMCDFTDPDRQKFHAHFLRHREYETPRFCILCGKYFSNMFRYSHHGNWAHKNTFNRTKPINQGKRNKRPPKPKEENLLEQLQCDICKKMVARKNLQKHVVLSHSNESCPCPYCAKILKSSLALDIHIRLKHEFRFICDFCGFGAYYRRNMSRHMRTKHVTGAAENEYVTCEVCGKTIKQKSMGYHMKCVHEGQKKEGSTYVDEKLEQCGGCGIKLTPRKLLIHRQKCFDPTHVTQLARRKKMMSLTQAANFACDDCDFIATSEAALRLHVVIHATWPCALCKAGFFQRRHYTEHLTKIHKRQLTDELCIGACVDREMPNGLSRKAVKNYQRWGQVGRNKTAIYDENGELYKKFSPHLECVTGDIICKFCDASFDRVRRIITHVETLHPEQAPYKCADCGLSFLNEHCYGKHVRKYHGIDYRMVNEPEGYIDSAMRFCNVLGVLRFERNKSGVHERNQRMYEKIKKQRKSMRGLPVDDE